MDQPGKVANPARGQLNRGKKISLSALAPENLVSRDGFGSSVPRQPAHFHTQAEYGAYLRDTSRVPRRIPIGACLDPTLPSRFSRICFLLVEPHKKNVEVRLSNNTMF